ncbi:MAG: alpha/beta fold hydrolase [Nitrospirae bacterium]|nr:alpha/beta fold hydrolase [Nitrospirota bacterium]
MLKTTLAKRFLLFSLIFLLSLSLYSIRTASAEKVGVVLLHEKNGSPAAPHLKGIISAMQGAGFIVIAPEMPYSKTRLYDKSYADTLTEIDSYVAQLKQKGATKVFIAGHSLGANVAIGYAAKTSVDGIVAIAPGHTPEQAGFQSYVGESVNRARQMVNDGKESANSRFTDSNQGRTYTIMTTAGIYLSWFAPEGPAVIPLNAQSIKPETAFMWVVGTQDKMYQKGQSYAFDKAPSNKCNKYLVVNSDHMNTPQDASADIIKWIREATQCVSSAH